MAAEYDRALLLLKIEEFTRNLPQLRSMRDLAMMELQEINDEMDEELTARREAAKQEAEAKAVEAEEERKRIVAKNTTYPRVYQEPVEEPGDEPAPNKPIVTGTVERRA